MGEDRKKKDATIVKRGRELKKSVTLTNYTTPRAAASRLLTTVTPVDYLTLGSPVEF